MLNKKFLATAAAFALTAAASASVFANTHEVRCMGVNDCSGKGSCKSANNACQGKNTCKGKGWTKMSDADCKTKGGTTMMENMGNQMGGTAQ